MTTADKFWYLRDQAVAQRDEQGKAIFVHDKNRFFIREDIKDNDDDKFMCIAAYWQALFGEKWLDTAAEAFLIRVGAKPYLDQNVWDYVYTKYQEKGKDETEKNDNADGSNGGVQVDNPDLLGEPASGDSGLPTTDQKGDFWG